MPDPSTRFNRAEDLERWPRTLLVLGLLVLCLTLYILSALMPDRVAAIGIGDMAKVIAGASLVLIRGAVSPWLVKLGENGKDGPL